MRIIHINKSDTAGGAAVAARRLMEAQIQIGLDTKMLVAEKNTASDVIETISGSPILKVRLFLNFIRDLAHYYPREISKSTRFAWSTGRSGFDISRHPDVVKADIIHLHWINQGYISIKSLSKIFQLNKPVVWTLHDMWGFTGGCHYSGSCHRFQQSCGLCPFLNDASENDLSNQQYLQKELIYKNSRLHFVTCSNWLSQMAQKASLLAGKQIVSIPNPIETNIFRPKAQIEARDALGLLRNKKVILFGAANVTDPRKGMPHLIYALNKLYQKYPSENIELVVFGKTPPELGKRFPYPVNIMNYIGNRETLVNLYNAADVFVLPSLEDNLPNTVMEAMACGLPVVAFRIGGVPEMVRHGITGFLASPGNGDGLADWIGEILFSRQNESFRENARRQVEDNYAPQLIAQRYLELYKSLLYNG